jgi:hypothetical protein
MFATTLGLSSFVTSSSDSMFATTPSCPVAVTVKEAEPTSRAPGVPDNVPVFPSIDSQAGLSFKEYEGLPESVLKVVDANWNKYGWPIRPIGGNCAFRG